jgi:predicted  nucleic acid-binding Zn-ribbon protein
MNGKPGDNPTARERELTEVAFTEAMERIAKLEAELDAKHAKLVEVADKLQSTRAELDTARVEAAAMHNSIADTRDAFAESRSVWQATTIVAVFDKILQQTSSAGRAIAERVPLWRELEAKLHSIREAHGDACKVNGEPCWNCRMSIKLAALDEKGTRRDGPTGAPEIDDLHRRR